MRCSYPVIDNYPTIQNYLDRISFLEIKLHTIDVNRKNYKKRLDIITEQSEKEGGANSTNLKFLEEFLNVAEKKYQEQIKNDCALLELGLRVREKFIDTIKGMVEIEQFNLDDKTAARDRSFQQDVQSWGVGFATAAFTASAISPFMEKILQPLAESVPPKPKEKQTSLTQTSVQSSQSKTIDKQPPPPPTSIWWVSGLSLLVTLAFSIGSGYIAKCWAKEKIRSRYKF
ncbi:hypothetical protein [Microcoleus sp. S13_B4]|uniref:hypothetical protein n=1 Tax=Microcoleus sp. S13_B4 TaxID=3055408 RepID=UPI002FD70842